jgi:hypothetical protein
VEGRGEEGEEAVVIDFDMSMTRRWRWRPLLLLYPRLVC